MCSLTGRYADGWYPSFLSPELYVEGWETVAEAAGDAGRDPGDISRSLVTAAMLAETREEAAELLGSVLVRIISLFLPPQSFEVCGYEHPLGVGQSSFVPTRIGREKALELAEEVPLEVLKDAYLWGTPEDVVAAVEDFRDAGVGHLVFGNLTPLAAVEQTGDSYARLEEVRETVQSRREDYR
jgi:phthiodiolone/phenolphthiodiolone dimycocerosates ketoreductase